MKRIFTSLIILFFITVLFSQLGSNKINELAPVAVTDSSWVSGVKVDTDSTSENFRIVDIVSHFAITDSSTTSDLIVDTLGQANVVIPNDLTIHGETTIGDSLHIGDAVLINGSGYLDLFNTALVVNDYNISTNKDLNVGDTIHVNNAKLINKNTSSVFEVLAPVNKTGSIYLDGVDVNIRQNLLTFENSGYFENNHAGSLRVVVDNFKVVGSKIWLNEIDIVDSIGEVGSWVENNYTSNDSSVCVIKNGDSLLIRTVYDNTRDLVQFVNAFEVVEFGTNAPLEWEATYLIPNTNPYTLASTLSSATIIHIMGDNATPYYYDSQTMNYAALSYYDGNHGYSDVIDATVASHDKTIEDVGSSWTDAGAEMWYLVRVIDATSLWFISKDSNTLTGNLTHASGATHTAGITVSSVANSQLKPNISNRTKTAYLDNETEITTDGVYYCKDLYFKDTHNIPNITASLDSIIAHVGEGDNTSVNLGIPDALVSQEYIFDKYGNCTQDHLFKAYRELDIATIGMMQSAKLAIGTYDSIFVRIPQALTINDGSKDWTVGTLMDYSTAPAANLWFTDTYWSDTTKPPSRMTQYIGTSRTNLDVMYYQQYSTVLGNTIDNERKDVVTNAWRLSSSGGKSYPYVADSAIGNLANNETYQVKLSTGYAKPQTNTDGGISNYYYNEGNDIIVNVDYNSDVGKDKLTLPVEYEGLKITVIDKSDSVTINSNYVNSGSIYLTSTDNEGYATLKLSKANTNNIVGDTDIIGDMSLTDNLTVAGSLYVATTLDIDGTLRPDSINVDGSTIQTATSSTNTILGIGNGTGITSGTDNTFIGSNIANVSYDIESESVIIGKNAGVYCGVSQSLFIGNYAGYYNNNGISNTFLGYSAGKGTGVGIEGDYNVFLGYNSGFGITTGSGNTFLGYDTGSTNTTGKYNIALGYDQDLTLATTDSALVIGVTSTPLILGDMKEASRSLTVDGSLTTNGTTQLTTDNGKTQFSDVSTTKHTVNIRANSGKTGLLSFTEDTVGDRWVIASETADTSLKFATGSTTTYVEKINMTASGDLIFADQGSSVNSGKISMIADNSGTPQTGDINVNFGTNPYLRFSPPNASGTATPTMDMRSDLISFFNGGAGIDYIFNFNGETNDGTITYMEDEDRFDFDNDVRVGGYVSVDNVMKAKMRFHDETPVAIKLAGNDTYTRLDSVNNYNFVTFGNIDSTAFRNQAIVIAETGHYTLDVNTSMSCDQATAIVHIAVAKNGTIIEDSEREYSAKDAGDINTICINDSPQFAVGDSLYCMVKSDSGADSLRIKHFNMVIKKDN